MHTLSSKVAAHAVRTPIKPQKVLVVDDNYANRIVAKTLLERENYAIILAENGKLAIDISRTQAFDLILMDIEMPVMDGLAATRLIRTETGPNRNTPIIAVTAYGTKAIHAAVIEAGMSDMLNKPIRVDQVKAAWARSTAQPSKAAPNFERLSRSPQFESSPNLDLPILISLYEAASPASLALLYQRFFCSAEAFISKIEESKLAAARKEAEALARLRKNAHALKGACANVGFKRVSLIAAALQNAAPEDITGLTGCLSPALSGAQLELETYLQQKFSEAS